MYELPLVSGLSSDPEIQFQEVKFPPQRRRKRKMKEKIHTVSENNRLHSAYDIQHLIFEGKDRYE